MELVEISAPLAAPPLAPWLRFGIIDATPRERASADARLRCLRDFGLHLQLAGESWVWCAALGGSLDVHPGDLLFFPPGFVHGWAYTAETHLALHVDLQRNPALTPHNYDFSYDMIESLEETVSRTPVQAMPVFHLHFPGDDTFAGWRIPLITRLKNPEHWRERLEQLLYQWQTRNVDTLASQLQLCETLGWALTALAEETALQQHLAGVDPRIAALLQQLNDPHTLAEMGRWSLPELAQRAGMGVTALRAAFRTATNRNPHQYLRERQVEHAAHLLVSSTRTIQEIAHTLGFDDPYHFSRIFRQITGLSPRHYRQQRVILQSKRSQQQ